MQLALVHFITFYAHKHTLYLFARTSLVGKLFSAQLGYPKMPKALGCSICFCLLQQFAGEEKSGKCLTEASPPKCYAWFCLPLGSRISGHGMNLHLVDVSKVLF